MDAEKIICCDRGDNDNALAAAILANGKNNDNNMWPLAMMNGGMNGWMNNPFAYLMFLALFRNGGFGNWGGDGNGAAAATTQGIEMQAQLNAIRTQLQDNQNADCIKSAIQGNAFALSQLSQNLQIDFNTLQKCCCDVQAAIQQVAGQVGFSAERVINAAQMGDLNIIQALKDCCCQTQQLVQRMGYENQLAQKDNIAAMQKGFSDLGFGMQAGFDRTNTGLERGFSQVGFQAQQDKCDIIRANQDNTQRIIDTLNNHWTNEQAREIQDLKAVISQKEQTDILTQRFFQAKRYGYDGCGCGNGCGNGCGC